MAYNVAYFQAVANGFTRNEVIAAAKEARDRARKPKWVSNPYSTGKLIVVSADQWGLVISDNTFLRWKQAAEQVGQLTVQPGCKERLLDVVRRVYVRANTCPTAGAGGDRPHIAAVGKAVAGV